jgi:hypothetical protein
MSKFFFTTAVLLCFCLFTKAQTIAQPVQAPSALEQGKYTLNVVFKVKGINSLTPLNETQQLALADFFKQEDENLTNATSSDMAFAAVTQLKAQLAAKFQSLLTADQLAVYSAKYPASYLAKKDYSKSGSPVKP